MRAAPREACAQEAHGFDQAAFGGPDATDRVSSPGTEEEHPLQWLTPTPPFTPPTSPRRLAAAAAALWPTGTALPPLAASFQEALLRSMAAASRQEWAAAPPYRAGLQADEEELAAAARSGCCAACRPPARASDSGSSSAPEDAAPEASRKGRGAAPQAGSPLAAATASPGALRCGCPGSASPQPAGASSLAEWRKPGGFFFATPAGGAAAAPPGTPPGAQPASGPQARSALAARRPAPPPRSLGAPAGKHLRGEGYELPLWGTQHRFHSEAMETGALSRDGRQLTKQSFCGRLSVITEDAVHSRGVHRYAFQFTAGPISSADGVGFIFAPGLPCCKNIQRIVSIFVNRGGRICVRARSEVVRSDMGLRALNIGDWVVVTVDLEALIATFAVWPAGGGPLSSATVNFGKMLAGLEARLPALHAASCGYFACVLKNAGVTVTLGS